MDTEKCTALLCVLETGSLSAAAEQLGYTPSGVSRMMAALEAETGFPLLVRSRAGAQPTAECEALLPRIRELSRLGELYAAQAAALRGLDTGVVRVGSVYSAWYDWMARIIARFSGRHPGVEVRFLQGSSGAFYAQLAAHELDLCVASRREGDFDFIPITRDPLMAWVPADHPRAGEGVYPLTDFETEPYIDTYPDQETDNDRAFRAHGLTPHAQFLSIDVHATRAMVAAGLGVSLNNAILAHGVDLTGVVTLPTDPPCEVEIGIAAPRKEYRSPAAERFLQFALENLPE